MPFQKKILPKLHKFLFPRFYKNALFMQEKYEDLQLKLDLMGLKLLEEKDKVIKLQSAPKPTMADLMRECLGVLPLNFTDVQEKTDEDEEARLTPEALLKRSQELGLPKDFLDTVDAVKREAYVAQLYQIWQFEVFPIMVDHYINLQGNWTLRKAIDDMQVFAGRMTVNGIYLIKNKVKSGHDEYKEKSKPPEEFDEHELDEGFNLDDLTSKK